MLPESLLKFNTAHGRILPHYLDDRDHPWLRLLWDEYLSFVGRPKGELCHRLKFELPFSAPKGKRQMVSHWLNRIFRTSVSSLVAPTALRARLFVAASNSLLDRKLLIKSVAGEFGISPEELENSLYADLPSQRCLTPPKKEVSVNDIALNTNLTLLQGLLARARSVEVQLTGNSSAVVRHAKRKGLICVVKKTDEQPETVRLSISGPYSLFRCTLLYGRVLGEIIPVLSWCHSFELSAEIVVEQKLYELTVKSGDPVFPSEPPKPFDSKLEEKFCRSFQRITKKWDVIREPEPVTAEGTLIFPDFALVHREDPRRRWLIEIVGYWTPDYLEKKLRRLRDAKVSNLLLCIKDKLNCSDAALPEGAAVIRFSREIKATEVLRVVESSDEEREKRGMEMEKTA